MVKYWVFIAKCMIVAFPIKTGNFTTYVHMQLLS